MYGEDLDLALRLRLAGWGVGVVPAARVEHDYDFAKGDYKWFHLERNRWWTVLGAYPTPLLVAARCRRCSPSTSRCWSSPRAAAGCGRSCARRPPSLRSLPWALRRRARVQAGRARVGGRVRRGAERLARLAVPRRAGTAAPASAGVLLARACERSLRSVDG